MMKKISKYIPYALLIFICFQICRLYACSDRVDKTIDKSEKVSHRGSKVVLENSFDTILFNTMTNCPEMVTWKITPDRVRQLKVKRDDYPFTPDDTPLLNDEEKVTTGDYTDSGFDRGHMCPAQDNRFSKKAMSDCMEMTNICPQYPAMNRGSWKRIEDKCRNWCQASGNVVYVSCGPMFTSDNYKFIGTEHKIAVPNKFFKVVCMYPKKGKAKSIGFICDNNEDDSGNTIKSMCCSVNDVESITGFDFFGWLPDDIEEDIESHYSYSEWH